MTGRSARRRAAVLGLAAWAACAPGGDVEGWARSRAELEGRGLGRLSDATPYPFPAADVLTWFWCRWSLDAPLSVSLPPDAEAAERALLERALAAWEAALPGLHFQLTDGPAPLRLRFRHGAREGASTAAGCRVVLPVGRGEAVRAELDTADVALRRSETDAWGRPIRLTPAELLGSAVHELGHALGLQGHARRGSSVMVRETEAVRRVGSRLLRGDPLREPALAALYAVPTGSVVVRRALPAGATRALDRLARDAERRGLGAVRVQLGDAAARIHWGAEPEFEYFLREPGKLLRNASRFSESLLPPLRAPGPAAD